MPAASATSIFLRTHPLAAAIAALLVALGAASFYQSYSPLFDCGNGAGYETWWWVGAAAAQSVLFMAACLGSRLKRLYVASQWLVLPVALLAAGQLADAYPRPFLMIAALMAGYFYARSFADRFAARGRYAAGPTAPVPQRIFDHLAEAALFVITAWLVHSTLAFFVLHSPGIHLTDTRFYAIFAVACAVAFFLVRHGSVRPRVDAGAIPPLLLLVVFLLRAKLPDTAYDSLFYKATLPIMIADWRTALTGLPDHTLLGTNFLEIVNSQLRIFDPAHSPALAAALAFMALWLIVPAAGAALRGNENAEGDGRDNSAGRALAAQALVLLTVSLSEPLVAAGTAYQEPALVLLMAAAVLAGPLGWFMLAAACAVKITVLFFVPCIVVWRCVTVDRAQWAAVAARFAKGRRNESTTAITAPPATAKRNSRRLARIALALSLALAVLVLGGQFYRNYVFTGRVLAPSEALAGITDPQGRMLKRIDNDPVFDAVGQRGYAEVAVSTALHMLTLDQVITPTYLGFHVMPSSRLPLLALLLGALMLAARWRRLSRGAIVMTLAYLVCFLVFLKFFSQGRHMAAASAAGVYVCALLLRDFFAPADRPAVAAQMPVHGERTARWLAVLGLAVFAAGDQRVGSFLNDGWECGRHLFSAIVKADYETPAGALDRKLAAIVRQYRSQPLRGTVIPSVMCPPGIDSKPYFGAHYTYAPPSLALAERFIDTDPERLARVPLGTLAICFPGEKSGFPPALLRDFELEGSVDGVTVLVSKPLLAGEPAQSLSGAGFRWPRFIAPKTLDYDFVASWLQGTPDSDARAATPTGRPALRLEYEGQASAVLLAPHAMRFDNLRFLPGSEWRAEYALPFHTSDGMEVGFLFEVNGKPYFKRIEIAPRASETAPLAWKEFRYTLPKEAVGKGSLTISASSGSGNGAADWAAFRRLELRSEAH